MLHIYSVPHPSNADVHLCEEKQLKVPEPGLSPQSRADVNTKRGRTGTIFPLDQILLISENCVTKPESIFHTCGFSHMLEFKPHQPLEWTLGPMCVCVRVCVREKEGGVYLLCGANRYKDHSSCSKHH